MTTAVGKAGDKKFAIPSTMKAWVLEGPGQLKLVEKPVPEPGPADVLVRIDACAICGTDIEIIAHGVPAMIQRRPALQQELDAGSRVHGHDRQTRPRRR